MEQNLLNKITTIAFSIISTLAMFFNHGYSEAKDPDFLSSDVMTLDILEPDIPGLFPGGNENFLMEPYQKDYFAGYYFGHLKDYPVNLGGGSCAFVAASMLLSYYDTYWSDLILPDSLQYETKSAQALFETSDHYWDYLEYKYRVSPGVRREPEDYSEKSKQEIDSLIDAEKSNYFQLFLIDLYKQNHSFTSNSNFGLNYYGVVNLFYDYLYSYLGFDSTQVSVETYSSAMGIRVRNKAIEYVRQGIPVYLGLSNHAVIAYDYDEENDDLYCQFGHSFSSSSHVTIEEKGYNLNQCNFVMALNFNIPHYCSDDYGIKDGRFSLRWDCPCSSMYPQNIIGSNDFNLFIDGSLNVTWDSLPKEKWYSLYGVAYIVEVFDQDENLLISRNGITNNAFRATNEEYTRMLSLNYDCFRLDISVTYPMEGPWIPWGRRSFSMPNTTSYLRKTQIKPHEWGLGDTFGLAQSGQVTKGDLTVSYSAVNCIYNEDGYVALSSSNLGGGEAYLQMDFNLPVYSFLYSYCMADLNDIPDGTATVEYKNYLGEWVTIANLLQGYRLTDLLRREPYCNEMFFAIYGIRYRTTTVSHDNEYGRQLLIDDVVLSLGSSVFDQIYSTISYRKTRPTY